MKNIRKTTITVETERLIVLSRSLVRGHCRECNKEVGMLSVNEAAMVGGLSPEAIRCQIEEHKLHTIETGGQTLVCLNSLTR